MNGFRLARVPEQQPDLYVAALRPGMLHLGGREADGVILNWLSPDDVPTSVAELESAGGKGKEVVARIFVIPSEETDRVRTFARRMITTYMNVHAYAEFQRWLGRGPALKGMWDRGRREIARRHCRPYPTRWSMNWSSTVRMRSAERKSSATWTTA